MVKLFIIQEKIRGFKNMPYPFKKNALSKEKGEKVLIIGSGGREHAIGWSVAQNPDVSEVIYAPGNAGTAMESKGRNIPIDVTKGNIQERWAIMYDLADIVQKEKIGMVIVGPELPLADGIVNLFHDEGYGRIFGPTLHAANIEADKFFSYDLMNSARVPQASGWKCVSDIQIKEALNIMDTSRGIVLKARGLTGGKGVSVYDSKEEALGDLEQFMKLYGQEVLVSERLFGQEVSVFALVDGNNVIPLEISMQDHKRLLDGDKGPNTGGMGAYGPAPIATALGVKYITENMMVPIVNTMKEGFEFENKMFKSEYKGFLYAGVIITEDGPKILEYNCRLGDPETQPLMMMLKEGLYQPISAALDGKLTESDMKFNSGAAVCVVLAADGYPGKYEKGQHVVGLDSIPDESEGYKVFHAGTTMEDGVVVTNGGRVLGVTARGSDIADAIEKSYLGVRAIALNTSAVNQRKVFTYRTDIASKALR
jgi:phosphoribosylamine---glycine ligase